ncbi:MAG: PAS domain-containing protein, partial [Actinomycetota bacterium]
QRLFPVKDPQGNLVAVEGIVRDVTRRKREEENLREREHSFRSLADNAPDIITRFDRDLKHVYANPSLTDKTGLELESVLGKTPTEAYGDNVTVDLFQATIGEVLDTGTPSAMDLTYRKDDDDLYLEARLIPEWGEHGGVETVLVISRDVTDRRRNEELLRDSYRRLRELDTQRRRLLSEWMKTQEDERHRIAAQIHDDPLQVMTAVGLMIEAIKSGAEPPLDADLEEIQLTAEAAVERLRTMMMRLRPPGMDKGKLANAIDSLINATGAEFDVAWTIRDHLTSEPVGEAKSIIYRIAEEAVANVRRHSAASHAFVSLDEHEGGYLVRIEDDGRGLSAEDADTTSPAHLGLTDMKERAELAGGWLHLETSQGSGTSIEFWIPANHRLQEAQRR